MFFFWLRPFLEICARTQPPKRGCQPPTSAAAGSTLASVTSVETEPVGRDLLDSSLACYVGGQGSIPAVGKK